MKNYKLLPIVAMALLATGCANVGIKTKNTDNSTSSKNALIGLSVSEQLKRTAKSLEDQDRLLETLKKGQEITSYNLVTHNNNVDAREGSINTVPLQYGQQNVPIAQGVIEAELEKQTLVEEQVKLQTQIQSSTGAMNQKVKRIVWNNDSLNNLAKNLAKSIGYDFVTKASEKGKADEKIDYMVENVTVKEAIAELIKKAEPVADVLVFEENKTVNVLYK